MAKKGNRVRKGNQNRGERNKNLFESTAKNLSIGGAVRPKRDLTRYVRWPKYIMLQRQRRVLYDRLKTPGAINQFSYTLTRDKAKNVLKLMEKYRPETKAEKKKRRNAEAAQKVENKKRDPSTKPYFLKTGLNHVTQLIESKRARFVVIAHDVDPIELVLWLPSLCRNMGVPFCFIKSKARLGALANMKTATCLALVNVRGEDEANLNGIIEMCNNEYTTSADYYQHTGDTILGIKSQHKDARKKKLNENQMIGLA